MSTVTCYIEEYHDSSGRLCARLREIQTARKVSLGTGDEESKLRFLGFLNATSSLFARFGQSDPIVVSGRIAADADHEVEFVNDKHLQYYIGDDTVSPRPSQMAGTSNSSQRADDDEDEEPLTPYDFDPDAIGFDPASGEFLLGNGD